MFIYKVAWFDNISWSPTFRSQHQVSWCLRAHTQTLIGWIIYNTALQQRNVTQSSLITLTLLKSLQVQSPEAALARLVLGPRHLDEALVEREVVPDGVLQQHIIRAQSTQQCLQQRSDTSNIKQVHSWFSCGLLDDRFLPCGQFSPDQWGNNTPTNCLFM